MSIIRNLTIADIELDDLGGITLAASSDLDLATLEISGDQVASSLSLSASITGGDIVFVSAQGTALTQQESEDSIANSSAVTPAITLQDGGTNLTGTPHSKLNFTGTGITLTNNGSGVATLAVSSGGGGDVSKVGTPVDNQVGVWTGDGTIEGNNNFTWDGAGLNLTGSGYIQLPSGTTAQRPVSPVEGMIRFNTDDGQVEAYIDGQWVVTSTNTGASLQLDWKFQTGTTATAPSNKKFKINNTNLANVTEIFINDTAEGNVDVSTIIGFLQPGNRIYLQQKDDATRALLVEVNSIPTDNIGWWTIPVTVLDNGITLFGNNKVAGFVFIFSEAVASTDELVKISANDTTAGFLNGKLLGGTSITLTENNDGGNETLTIDVSDIWVNTTGDTMTGSLLMPNGTQAAPSIAFSDDITTGIYSQVDGSIAFSTNGMLRGGWNDLGQNLINGSVLQFFETAGAGANTVGFAPPANIATNVLWTLPDAGGTTGQVLTLGTPNTQMTWATPAADQNLWETITSDAGSAVANTTTDTLTIAGGTGISTAISGDTLTITNSSSATPKALFLAHNGVTTQTLTTTAVTALFNTTVRSDSIYSYTAGVVTINKTGWFKVTSQISTDSTGSRSQGETQLVQNGTPIVGSLAWTYNRNVAQGNNTASTSWYVNNTSGGTVSVNIREQSGTVVTSANSSRLFIEEIDAPS